jgi:hypothetical protein
MTDEQPTDEVEKRALLFESMAAQIRLNKDTKFGGAFLCIPPGGAEPFSSLMLNQEQPGIFWAAIKTLADMALAETDRQQRQQGFR